MVKKTKLFGLPKFWESLRQHFGFFDDWRNFGNPQKKWQVFETGGRTYFALLVDGSITYPNKIGSSAIRP